MNIQIEKQNGSMIVSLEGRLDTTTSPELEKRLETELTADVTKLEINFADLAYISSAGLRVMLATQKKMNKQGEMIVTHVNEDIQEVFEITGFSDILTIVD